MERTFDIIKENKNDNYRFKVHAKSYQCTLTVNCNKKKIQIFFISSEIEQAF